eukprot:SAG31_NODE_1617_length_7733_cov_6.446817_1_plen_28_part_10
MCACVCVFKKKRSTAVGDNTARAAPRAR